MESPKISIIVPVYNAERKIVRCIESILAQTYINFELLLINDGSKDSSEHICKEYALKDKRILVFSKNNGGVSSARNVGIKKSSGEWITFCDSDDYVNPNYLQLYVNMMSSNADLLSQGFISPNWKGKEPKIIAEDDFFITKHLFLPYLLNMYESSQLGFVWCKAFRRDLLQKECLKFNEGIFFMEDLDFILRYCMLSKYIVNTSCYSYVYEFSSKGKKFGKQDVVSLILSFFNFFKTLDKDNKNEEKITKVFSKGIISALLIYYNDIIPERLDNCLDSFIKYFYKYINFVDIKSIRFYIFKISIVKNKKYINFLLKLINKR